MSFQDLPLFSMSVKTIIYWSLIVDNNWRQYAAIIPIAILNVFQFTSVVLADDGVIRDAYFVVLWFNTLIRAGTLTYNRQRYEMFLKDVDIAYKDILRDEDAEMNRMLAETARNASGLAKVNFAFGVLGSFGFLIYPLIAGIRALPYSVHIPGVDKNASPWYGIIYTFQVLVTIPGNCIFISFANLAVAVIMFSIMMHKVLQNHLSKLKDLKAEQIWCEIMWCIRYHHQIIRYVEIVNSLMTYIYLVEFLTSGGLLCALLFQLNTVSSLTQVVMVVSLMVINVAQIAGIYWYTNELYHQSVELAFEAYNTNWFDFDVGTQKILLMLITRMQKPSSILIGNMYPMTLEMFQSLLNTSYSYFTLLRRFYE